MAYPFPKASQTVEETPARLAVKETDSRPEPAPEPEAVRLEEHAGPIHLAAEWIMVFTFPLLLAGLFYLAGSRLQASGWLWVIALAIPLGLVLGDLVSGVVHWAADNYFHYNTPFLGAAFIKPFRLHHIYPKDICTHNVVTVIGNTCILAAPLLLLCLYLLWRQTAPVWLALAIFVVGVMTLATVLTNLFHKWAHLDAEAPLVVKWLQKCKLILGAEHHEVHHTPPYNRYYCITNGWLNPVLDRLRFFPRMELALSKIGINTTLDNP